MVRETVTSMTILALAIGALGLGGALSQAQAASTDVTSPAGTVTGAIVVFSPALGVSPATLPSPSILTLRGGLITPPLPMSAISASGPALPGIVLLTPAPATGSLVVPLSVPPVSGVGPSITQFQLVIPGPNPAQNTPISLAQLLSTLLSSMQPARSPGPPASMLTPPLVSVFSTPSR